MRENVCPFPHCSDQFRGYSIAVVQSTSINSYVGYKTLRSLLRSVAIPDFTNDMPQTDVFLLRLQPTAMRFVTRWPAVH